MTSIAFSSSDSSRTLFIVVFSVLLLLTLSSSASNISTTVTHSSNGSTTESTAADGAATTSALPKDVQSPEISMNTGLRSLYTMTTTFLNVVQPPGKNLYDELEVETGKRKEIQSVSKSVT